MPEIYICPKILSRIWEGGGNCSPCPRLYVVYDLCLVCVVTPARRVRCLSVSDLPRVSKLPPDVFVARGLPARLDCPTTANPSVTSVVWSKDDRVVAPLVPKHSSGGGLARLTTDRRGSLLFRSVSTQDEGQYSCTPYSPLGVGQASRLVHLHVRGSSMTVRDGHGS